MLKHYPIYTIETECQDCYRCLRHCPVKAIQVENGRATVVPELCIACGQCVAVCPAHAKQVRSDLFAVFKLLRSQRPAYVSLAPSWVAEFPDVSPQAMIAALRKLGFSGVSETALGAQEVSAGVAKALSQGAPRLMLSTACPAAVDFIRGYMPELVPNLTPLLSPLLSHCRMMRRAYGQHIGMVFFGPCVAKKTEADNHPGLLDAAMTFTDLRAMLRQENIHPESLVPGPADIFMPHAAKEGALYPIEGGMTDTVKAYTGNASVCFTTLSGIQTIQSALEGIQNHVLPQPVFVEMLACVGGCVRGPCISSNRPRLLDQLDVFNRAVKPAPDEPLRTPVVPINERKNPAPVDLPVYSEDQYVRVLRLIGKFTPEDEINCGGCGHETCRGLARAMLEGLAEPSMCIHFLRKRATRKANALLRCIPAGVVIADARLHIIECNEHFARLFGEEILTAYEASPGMEGAALEKIVPFIGLFRRALESETDIHRDALRQDDRVFSVTIFTIEPRSVIGGVIFDVTGSELRREEIAQRAREIIRKNLETVQEIACRLGENMADTEILLRSLSEGFSSAAKPISGKELRGRR
ncbi:[Fe-Fe] hydrogenase large subunit C-terminal domain-containing protein [Solidesulfovibrio sp. C21]|uniref:[Fe-Fe] hydrogenase large subunit C-terminal domain-containing protein n=1 Tax=Solidesulfovibrio sp. C21 TaxID=3398613 RepID=UPI0039FCFD71